MPKGIKMKITEDFTPGDLEVTGIQDENGQPILFTDSANATLPSKILVVVESTHTGLNRNKVEYTMHGLESSASSWTDNYEKPVLLNHNPYSDNIGRVKQAEYCQSVIDCSKYCIKLTLEITNKDAIERFLDGRYKTFSIGGYTDSAKCSICGKDQITDGWCGHRRGKNYDGKECYWTLGKMEYDEISVVNCPADVNAQAIDIKVISGEPQKDDFTEEQPNSVTDMLDDIDGLLNDKNNDGADEGERQGTDDNGSQADNSDKTEDNNDPQEDQVAELQRQIDALTAENTNLKEKAQLDNVTILELTTKVEASDNAKEDAEQKLQIALDEKTILVKQNVEYARFAHKVLCEKVADMQILAGEKTAEERDTLITEYTTKTSRALHDMSKEIINRPRAIDSTRGNVTNPVPVTDGDTEATPNKGEKEENTLVKFEEAFSNFFKSKM